MYQILNNVILKEPLIYKNGVHYLSEPVNTFEEKYIALRKQEGRLYTDEQVHQLPIVSKEDLLFHDWSVRKKSAEKLIYYLKKKNRPLVILDVGCGNGWLTNKLVTIHEKNTCIGIDVNTFELEIATRTFKHPNLIWLYGNIEKQLFKPEAFDIILFSTSAQYFPDLNNIIPQLFKNMKENGEIHIIDTPFYSDKDQMRALNASKKYFTDAGFPELNNYYHPKSRNELKGFSTVYLYKPTQYQKVFCKLMGITFRPFPWIVVGSLQSQ